MLLRLVDIPFEHATRYHVWLGHLTMVLFTLHGVLYVIAWAMEGRLIEQVRISSSYLQFLHFRQSFLKYKFIPLFRFCFN